LRAADFRIRAEIADQDDFVDTACHDLTPLDSLPAECSQPVMQITRATPVPARTIGVIHTSPRAAALRRHYVLFSF
jgi:hypothetical protein